MAQNLKWCCNRAKLISEILSNVSQLRQSVPCQTLIESCLTLLGENESDLLLFLNPSSLERFDGGELGFKVVFNIIAAADFRPRPSDFFNFSSCVTLVDANAIATMYAAQDVYTQILKRN